ncbi:hypothetical protein KUCAC02_006643, partial [Chaenocephalus aceratus]
LGTHVLGHMYMHACLSHSSSPHILSKGSVSSCSAVPASCHANALQLWRWHLPRQVAVGDITGLPVTA